MSQDQTADHQTEIDRLRTGIRDIAHDISNPLGVLRMAAYYLQTAHPDNEKREQYYKIIGDTVGRVEDGLRKLRALAESGGGSGTSGGTLTG
jgi:nitrogen-specific signal transduction histidine kinase